MVRVHPENLVRQGLPPEAVRNGIWARRFGEINDWERYLAGNGIRIVKLFLNVSKEEQRKRLLARIDEPAKNWKFSAADARERQNWDSYMHAFSEVLSHTSQKWAPWYVIPADNKWFARLAVAAVLVSALMEIDPQYPTLDKAKLADLQAAAIELGDKRKAPRKGDSPAVAAAAPSRGRG